jgi:hypothetical protein
MHFSRVFLSLSLSAFCAFFLCKKDKTRKQEKRCFYLGFWYFFLKKKGGCVCEKKTSKFLESSASHIVIDLFLRSTAPLLVVVSIVTTTTAAALDGDEREADTDHGTNEPGGGGEPAQGRVGRGVLSERYF